MESIHVYWDFNYCSKQMGSDPSRCLWWDLLVLHWKEFHSHEEVMKKFNQDLVFCSVRCMLLCLCTPSWVKLSCIFVQCDTSSMHRQIMYILCLLWVMVSFFCIFSWGELFFFSFLFFPFLLPAAGNSLLQGAAEQGAPCLLPAAGSSLLKL